MTKGGTEIDFNVFAGAETGILKGANVNNKACISKNFHNLSNLQKDFEITCMGFGETENEILLGLRNQTVKVYDVQFRSFSQSMDAKVNNKLSFLVTTDEEFSTSERLGQPGWNLSPRRRHCHCGPEWGGHRLVGGGEETQLRRRPKGCEPHGQEAQEEGPRREGEREALREARRREGVDEDEAEHFLQEHGGCGGQGDGAPALGS